MVKSPDELSVLFGADSGLGGEMPVHRTHYGVCRCHYLYRHPRVSYVCVCVRVCVVHPRTLVVARITELEVILKFCPDSLEKAHSLAWVC